MPKKVVALTVHRNTVERRRKNDLAKELTTRVKKMVKDRDIRAYAIVGIGADGAASAMWDTGAILPMWGFPDTVAGILRRDIEEAGLEEDWRPSLTARGTLNG